MRIDHPPSFAEILAASQRDDFLEQPSEAPYIQLFSYHEFSLADVDGLQNFQDDVQRTLDIKLVLIGGGDGCFTIRFALPNSTAEQAKNLLDNPRFQQLAVKTGFEQVMTPDPVKWVVLQPHAPQEHLIRLRLHDPAPREHRDDDYVVWFGTHRRPKRRNGEIVDFTGERDTAVHYGMCRVPIPKSHGGGSTRSWWSNLTKTDDRLTLRALGTSDVETYWKHMSTALASLPIEERDAVVFIHGFNASFVDAALRAAQFGLDLSLKMMAFYSWPSKGRISDYSPDEETIQASEPFVTDYLSDVAVRSGARRVHVIAHSMGNRVLLRAVQRITAEAQHRTKVTFGQFVLAAPDVDVDLFRDLSRDLGKVSDATTLYVCRKDKALEASKWKHSFLRAGLTPPVFVAPGIETISASNLNLTLLGHGYFAEAREVLHDIHSVLFDAKPAAKRGFLNKIQTTAGDYWEIRA